MSRYIALGEIPYLTEKRTLALIYARHHPLFVAGATVRRVVRFWTGYWSFSRQYLRNEPLDAPNVPFCLFLVYMMFRGIRPGGESTTAPSCPTSLPSSSSPSPTTSPTRSMDYRQPLEPSILILVVVGLFGTGSEDLHATPAYLYEADPTFELALEEEPEPAIV